MMFPNNQVGHFYAATTVATDKVKKSDAPGTIRLVKSTTPHPTMGDYFYYEYRGADSDAPLMRSDVIYKKNLLYTNVTKADAMAEATKDVKIELSSDVNNGAPVSGQDYVVNIFFSQYIGISDEDIHVKHGVVHAFAGMTAAQFYLKLAASLFMNFSKEAYPLLDIYVDTTKVAGVKTIDGVKLPVKEDGQQFTEASSITLKPALQDWELGIKEQTPVYYSVGTSPIIVSGDELTWSKVSETINKGAIKNGKKVADMEYFYMGERGDQYRNVGWPKVIKTNYIIDPSKEYDIVNIHYAYVGYNESVQKSEKDIFIAVPKDTATTNLLPTE